MQRERHQTVEPSDAPTDNVVMFPRPPRAPQRDGDDARPTAEVLPFRRDRGVPPATTGARTGDDDYRRRMRANAAAFVLCLFLVVCGVWLVNAITMLPAHLDCRLSPHRPCAGLSATDLATLRH
jgi:hypothetical protein